MQIYITHLLNNDITKKLSNISKFLYKQFNYIWFILGVRNKKLSFFFNYLQKKEKKHKEKKKVYT